MKLNHNNNIFRVCINDTRNEQISGVIYGRQLNAPIPFTDIGGFLSKIDGILDAQNFPRAYQRKRDFVISTAPVDVQDADKGFIDESTFATAEGDVATFDLSVISRQNTTWQGTIDWKGDEPRQSFKSVMELIRLIDATIFPL